MGVSIMMRAGTVMRSKGEPKDITPGRRSHAASILRSMFGEAPFEIDEDSLHDLRRMSQAASVYTQDSDNMWLTIKEAVEEHHCVTIAMEY